MECMDCILLEESIARCHKLPVQRRQHQAELEAHWQFQESLRDHYCSTIIKAVENKEFDLSMHVDGGAADGMTYSPFYFQDITGEPPQHTCLKTHNTFVKLHGWGRIIYQSYPQLEEHSSNMIAEVIFRAIHHYMHATNKRCLRNLYIEMDNAGVNKSNLLIAALSILVVLGVCRKIKVSYLARGHSHCDGDGDIGIAGNVISRRNLATFEDFSAAVKSAFSERCGNTAVERIVGCTDYQKLLPEYPRNDYGMHGKQYCILSLHTSHGM